jgi:ADP-ribose pyrophosphatase YjhB (NUDIX family)
MDDQPLSRFDRPNVQWADVAHFQEPGRLDPVQPEDKIPDPIYSKALDYLVIACVDVVLMHQRQLLLVKRSRYPRPSWWIIGGRMSAGEHPKKAAQRKVAQEASINHLPLSRFHYVGVYSTCFAFRHQSPEHHGSHSLNLTYVVELVQPEREQIVVRSDEHADWKWIDMDRVGELLDLDQVMDQALLQIVRDLQVTIAA